MKYNKKKEKEEEESWWCRYADRELHKTEGSMNWVYNKTFCSCI